MKKIISASRRTDLVSFFPEWLASAFREERVSVYGPSGHVYSVNLSPEAVHTIVLWSKNFANLLENRAGLKDALEKYDQIYLHFSITGLGGTFIEHGVPSYQEALYQIENLVGLVGNPRRISVRFDPVIYWKEGDRVCTNLRDFEKIAPTLEEQGIDDIRISFAQWYGKAKRRAAKHRFLYIDPPREKKLEDAHYLVQMAKEWNLNLFSCSQDFLTEVNGIRPSSCIDGSHLQSLHPHRERASTKKDKTQRQECHCTNSVDIGSYTQFCPHSCLYCYANPKI
jgi:DNA repair photolyase